MSFVLSAVSIFRVGARGTIRHVVGGLNARPSCRSGRRRVVEAKQKGTAKQKGHQAKGPSKSKQKEGKQKGTFKGGHSKGHSRFRPEMLNVPLLIPEA